MPKRPQPRTLNVLRKQKISAHMLRVTLGGDGLDGFPDDQDGAYVKLNLPSRDNDADSVVRTYTVRHYRAEIKELDIDFVLHDVSGPAADWARQCQPGDNIRLGGPGPKKMVDHSADWILFVGDMSALPAISANLECLPSHAKGYALLEIIDEKDKQDLPVPKNITLNWIVNPHPDEENSYLLDAVKSIQWHDGHPSVWVAGEFSQSLSIRTYLRSQRGIQRQQMYCSSYWQIGKTEDGHRISKRQAAEQLG